MAIDLSGARRMYALVTLEVDMQTINAETIKGVPYQSVSRSFFGFVVVLWVVSWASWVT